MSDDSITTKIRSYANYVQRETYVKISVEGMTPEEVAEAWSKALAEVEAENRAKEQR